MDDTREMMSTATVFRVLFEELGMNARGGYSERAVAIFGAMVRLAMRDEFPKTYIDAILNNIEYCPTCAAETEILWSRASTEGLERLRFLLILKGKFLVLLRLSRYMKTPINSAELCNIGPALARERNELEIEAFFEFVNALYVPEFLRLRYTQPFHKHKMSFLRNV